MNSIKGRIVTDSSGKKRYSGYIDENETVFALERAIKEMDNWIEKMPEPEPGNESTSEKGVAESFKKNIETTKSSLESMIELNNAFMEMATAGAPLVEFLSVESPSISWNPSIDEMPYIELWGTTTDNSIAYMKDLTGNITLKDSYGTLDGDEDDNRYRYNIEIAKKSGSSYITRPTPDQFGRYNDNTIYLVIRGETVKDADGNKVESKYYDFSMIEKTVKIVKIGNRPMAHVRFSFNFPLRNGDKYTEYPEKNFSVSEVLPPYELSEIDTGNIPQFFEEHGFWLYVVDNRQANI